MASRAGLPPACPTDLSAPACPSWSWLSSTEPAPPLLSCFTPAGNRGAILPFSFTPHERSHRSCRFKLRNHPQIVPCLHPQEYGPSPPQHRLPSAPGLLPSAINLRQELLGGPLGEQRVEGSFSCPAGGPCGIWGLSCLICLPLGWQHPSFPIQTNSA